MAEQPERWDSASAVCYDRDIHEPVPLFKQEIRRPVERFLQRIAPGKAFQRANWGVGALTPHKHLPGDTGAPSWRPHVPAWSPRAAAAALLHAARRGGAALREGLHRLNG